MFERFSRSWQLVKASGSVLMQDKKLLMFPAISGVATVLVVLCFALPIIGFAALDGVTKDGEFGVGSAIVAFFFYLSQYFVIFFFNTALVGAAMMRLEGREPTVSDGINLAMSKWQSILGYAAIAATVGLILRAIQERVGFIGKIIVGLLGAGWTMATFMVVPVLVSRDVGPIDAVKESVMLLKQTWGENVIGQAGLGAAFGLIHVAVIIFGLMLIVVAALTQSVFAIALAIIIAISLLILAALVHAALSGIYSAALYRFATGSKETAGFDTLALQSAFAPK